MDTCPLCLYYLFPRLRVLGERNRAVRDLVYQYHYVSGIKVALKEPRAIKQSAAAEPAAVAEPVAATHAEDAS